MPACLGVEGESECGPLVIFLNRILNQFVIDDSSTDRNPKPRSVSSCAVSISCQVCHFFQSEIGLPPPPHCVLKFFKNLRENIYLIY